MEIWESIGYHNKLNIIRIRLDFLWLKKNFLQLREHKETLSIFSSYQLHRLHDHKNRSKKRHRESISLDENRRKATNL